MMRREDFILQCLLREVYRTGINLADQSVEKLVERAGYIWDETRRQVRAESDNA